MEIYLNPLSVAVCTPGSDPGGLRSARREGASTALWWGVARLAIGRNDAAVNKRTSERLWNTLGLIANLLKISVTLKYCAEPTKRFAV